MYSSKEVEGSDSSQCEVSKKNKSLWDIREHVNFLHNHFRKGLQEIAYTCGLKKNVHVGELTNK